jgi:hypothetical protein
MKKENILAFILFIAILFLMLGLSASQFPAEQTVEAACAATQIDIIAGAQGDVYGGVDFAEPDSYYLVTYVVQDDTLMQPKYEPVPEDLTGAQRDFARQHEAWHVFANLIPLENRQMVAQYNVFTDGFDNTLAAVDQISDDPTHWVLEIDIADLADKNLLTFTLIHEYAHILTLNATQMEPDQELVNDPYNPDLQIKKSAACPNYFTGMGCSHADAYINIFYKRFWTDINDEWEKTDALQYDTEDYTPYYKSLHQFYTAHQDQFVDDYAVTHPAEDIAESFTYFVFAPKPTGNSIKEQKIAFFYEYPELVRLRENILNRVCSVKQ